MNDKTHCPTCGASLKQHWHRLTPGLVRALIETIRVVHQKGENRVAKHELTLEHSAYGNYQKLRFHGLIAKYKEDGVVQRGQWLITKRGADFLANKIAVPHAVQTFHNKVVDHSESRVYLHDVMTDSDIPYFEGYNDFVGAMSGFGEIDMEDTTGELVQQQLI